MSIILVHDFWGGAAHWTNVILELKKEGYSVDDIHAIEVPLTSLKDDADRVRAAISTAKAPVLLVGHSYGGAVITEAGTDDKVKGESSPRPSPSPTRPC